LFSERKPFVELSIVERLNKHCTVKQYKYYKMLIQEFHIKLDIGFINALIKMTEKYELSEEERVSLQWIIIKSVIFCRIF